MLKEFEMKKRPSLCLSNGNSKEIKIINNPPNQKIKNKNLKRKEKS